jgi:hypothetical protein
MTDTNPEDLMAKALGSLPRMSAPPGWEQQVLKRIDDRERARPRRAWLPWAWKAALGAAAVGVAVWLLFLRSHPTHELAMRTEIVPAVQVVVRSSSSAKVGDTLRLEVTVGDAPGWDVRLYQERRLVASCASGARCVRDGTRGRAEIVLPQPGSHRVLLLAGSAIPPTRADLDEDVSAAGADVKMLQSAPLTVLPFEPAR